MADDGLDNALADDLQASLVMPQVDLEVRETRLKIFTALSMAKLACSVKLRFQSMMTPRTLKDFVAFSEVWPIPKLSGSAKLENTMTFVFSGLNWRWYSSPQWMVFSSISLVLH